MAADLSDQRAQVSHAQIRIAAPTATDVEVPLSREAGKPRDRRAHPDPPSQSRIRVPYVFPNRRIEAQTTARALPNPLQARVTSVFRRRFQSEGRRFEPCGGGMSCVRPPLCGASGMTRRPALRPIYARSCNSFTVAQMVVRAPSKPCETGLQVESQDVQL